MAVLDETQRFAAWAKYMRSNGLVGTHGPISKQQIRAALDAVDDWVNANQASFQAALPSPANAVLTKQQKAALLVYVVEKRFLEDV